eukprot:NODE_1218_length_1745_cov_0.809842.p1 type:complete len:169 gc:universal NODE_1218_length_1745_cov_0.809842:1031-525(-)
MLFINVVHSAAVSVCWAWAWYYYKTGKLASANYYNWIADCSVMAQQPIGDIPDGMDMSSDGMDGMGVMGDPGVSIDSAVTPVATTKSSKSGKKSKKGTKKAKAPPKKSKKSTKKGKSNPVANVDDGQERNSSGRVITKEDRLACIQQLADTKSTRLDDDFQNCKNNLP